MMILSYLHVSNTWPIQDQGGTIRCHNSEKLEVWPLWEELVGNFKGSLNSCNKCGAGEKGL